MGSRTRRLVFVRLMAVVAICFMAVGHLLYSMTVGLDGYARLHMSVIAPSATSHKDLQDLMSHDLNGAGARRMNQRSSAQHAHLLKGCEGKNAEHRDQCKLHFENQQQQQQQSRTKVKGSYSIKPVHDMPWDFQRLPFKDIAALNAHVRAHNASLVHVRHCSHLRLHPSVIEAGRSAWASSSPSPWQATSRDGGRSYVYSAFYDARWSHQQSANTKRQQREPGGRAAAPPRGAVKIIGVRDLAGSRPPAFCQLWFMDDDISHEEDEDEEQVDDGLFGMSRTPLVVPITAYPLSDPYSSRFAAFLYTCELPTRRPPVGVSMVPEACRPPTNYLPVVRGQGAPGAGGASAASATTPGEPQERVGFTVCVPALEEHYADVDGLLQMMEVNRMFGADRFVFFNQSTGSGIGDHLRNYVADKLAVVLPYSRPGALTEHAAVRRQHGHQHKGASSQQQAPSEISGLGWPSAARLASLNDCLYRNMYRTQYVAFLDVDELLVPRAHRKWADMLSDVSAAMTTPDTINHHRKVTAAAAAALLQPRLPARVVTTTNNGGAGGSRGTSGPLAFYFKTVSFRTERADDPDYSQDRKVQRLRLTTLLKTDREAMEPLAAGKLRYLVRPRRINAVSAGGLSPVDTDDGAAGLPVPESKGLVHIYRRADIKTRLPQPRKPTIKDKVLLPYYDVILARVLERHERLENPIT